MEDVHNIIAAIMTNQSAEGVDMIKDALGRRTEDAITSFVTDFRYHPPVDIVPEVETPQLELAPEAEPEQETPPNDDAA